MAERCQLVMCSAVPNGPRRRCEKSGAYCPALGATICDEHHERRRMTSYIGPPYPQDPYDPGTEDGGL